MSFISCAQIVGKPVIAPAPAAPPNSAPPAFSSARRDGPAFAPALRSFTREFFVDLERRSRSVLMNHLPARNLSIARTVEFDVSRRGVFLDRYPQHRFHDQKNWKC